MQSDYRTHTFKQNVYFEDIIEIYEFDRNFRNILFDSIERIEIALRTKMIYHLSMSHGGLWYLDANLFETKTIIVNGITQTIHSHALNELKKEFKRSKETFVTDHLARFSKHEPDAWKIFEVASMGTLSKLYKSLKHQIPEKSAIAKEMGLNLHSELSSWLEAITYVRNIIAHHSRLWSRNMVKQPTKALNRPIGQWQKRFPDEFYKEIFRLNNWDYTVNGIKKRPGVIVTWTKKLIYTLLPKGALEELQANTPLSAAGNKTKRLHQGLTLDIGEPHLEKQLISVIILMNISDKWNDFLKNFGKIFQKDLIEIAQSSVNAKPKKQISAQQYLMFEEPNKEETKKNYLKIHLSANS